MLGLRLLGQVRRYSYAMVQELLRASTGLHRVAILAARCDVGNGVGFGVIQTVDAVVLNRLPSELGPVRRRYAAKQTTFLTHASVVCYGDFIGNIAPETSSDMSMPKTTHGN